MSDQAIFWVDILFCESYKMKRLDYNNNTLWGSQVTTAVVENQLAI